MNQKIHYFLFLILSLQINFVVSQNTKFERSYGSNGYDYGYSVKQTFDNGFIIAGSSNSYGDGSSDAYIIKIDSAGGGLWHKTFGGINIDKAYSIQETSDSGFVIAGYTNSFGAGGYDIYVVRTNKTGDTLWTKTYGGIDWDFGFSIETTNDGGFIIAGGTYSSGAGSEDMYLIKTDASGIINWTKTYGGTNDDEAKSVKQTSDGGYILAGYTKSFGDVNKDIYIVKTDNTGDTLWTKKFGGTAEDEAADIIEATNGEFVFVGGTASSGVGEVDCIIFRIGANGDSLWSHTYGTLHYNFASSIIETPSQNLIFSNTTEDSGGGLRDANIFMADMGGWFINTRTYGAFSNEETYSIDYCRDKGYVICGSTDGYDAAFTDIYVVKTDSTGISAPFIISVNEIDQNIQKLNIYPNPAQSSESININIPKLLINSEESTLLITDVSGSIIRKIQIAKNEPAHNVELKNIESGAYFISLFNGQNIIAHSKIIVIK
jgi:hypothetical protein